MSENPEAKHGVSIVHEAYKNYCLMKMIHDFHFQLMLRYSRPAPDAAPQTTPCRETREKSIS